MIRRRNGIIALVGAVLCASGATAQDSPTRPRTTAEDLLMFSQVLNQIRVNHPDSVDTHRMFMAAVEAMVLSVDPHSYVLPATRLSPERERLLRAGRLVPVPVTFRYFGGAPVVVAVDPGSAAARLNILPGDELLLADGAPITAQNAEELDITLAGEPGTTVALRLERRRVDGSLIELDRVVTRERTEESSAVRAAFLLDGGIGYVRLATFANERTADDLHDTLVQLEGAGMTGLLLDLRDNGGGLVDQAAEVAGEFLPRGSIIYTQEGSKPELIDTVRVERSRWNEERRYPIVVLVNRGTASAAELVAGALQDHDRALIVGRTTFGKALVMQPFPLTDGSLVVLVVGRVRTPCGRDIQRPYRSVTTRDYYRGTVDQRRLADRPSCTTAGGRTVYGGGGIHPDVTLEEQTLPLWLARIHEMDLPLQWVGGFVDAHGSRLTSAALIAADSALAQDAVRSFRPFATQQGVEIPADGDDRLGAILLTSIAGARWGSEGYHHVAAVLDPEIGAATGHFEAADALRRRE